MIKLIKTWGQGEQVKLVQLIDLIRVAVLDYVTKKGNSVSTVSKNDGNTHNFIV